MTATPIGDLIERMLAAGLPHASVVDSVRTIENLSGTSPGQVRDSRREYERDRKRDWRANRSNIKDMPKANDVGTSATASPDLSGTGPDDAVVLSSLTGSQKCIQKVKKTRKGTEQVEGRTARGTRITEDFQPSEEARELCRTLGIDPDALRVEFIDFWIAVPGSRGLKLDWDKTFKNRAREVASRRGRAFNGTAPRPGSREDSRERTFNALQRLNPFPYADDPGRGEGASAPIPGQLSLVKPARP